MNYKYQSHTAYWSTRDETRFLRSIGKHSNLNIARFNMLMKYKSCMINRSEWGKIDNFYVSHFIDCELEKIEKEQDEATKKPDTASHTQGRRYIPKVLAS